MNRLLQLSSYPMFNQIPIPLLLTAFTLFLTIPLQTAQPIPSSCVHMDFVMVLHETAQINENGEDYGYAAAYKAMIESFAKVLTLADDKTRVSVVGLNDADQYHVALPLTSDKATWESALTKKYKFDSDKIPSIQDGLKTVRENVFDDQKVPSKARLILVSSFTDPFPERFGPGLGQEVKTLNDMGNTLVLAVTRDGADQAKTTQILATMHEAFTKDLVLNVARTDADFIKEFSEKFPAWMMEKVNKKFCQPTNPPDEPKPPKPPNPTDPPAANTTKEENDGDGGSWAERVHANGVFQLIMTMIAFCAL